MAIPLLLEQVQALTNLDIALSVVFYDQMTNLEGEPSVSSALSFFNIRRSTKTQEVHMGVGGFGIVNEYNGTIEYKDFPLLFEKTYIHKEYADGFAVERKLWDDGMYNVISNQAASLGESYDRTKEYHAASIFNNAFSSSYLGGDSKALVATDHPSGASGAAQSNKGTAALTQDAVIAARIAMMGFKNSLGEPDMSIPDTLLVPINLVPTAEVIAGSNLKPGTANNDKNVVAGLRVVTNPWLTDSNNWFLIDSRKAKRYLNWYWRVMPEFKLDPSSDFNLVMRWRGYMRYSFGFDHWSWIYGSEVA
jgi:hypothetical protein